ncbi:hypothetical protein [Flagellimonas marinaquae]
MNHLKYAKGFLRKDHGQQADRQAKNKMDIEAIYLEHEQARDKSAVGHLTLHRSQADRFLKALPSNALGVGAHEPAGAPRAIQDRPQKSQGYSGTSPSLTWRQ